MTYLLKYVLDFTPTRVGISVTNRLYCHHLLLADLNFTATYYLLNVAGLVDDFGPVQVVVVGLVEEADIIAGLVGTGRRRGRSITLGWTLVNVYLEGAVY